MDQLLNISQLDFLTKLGREENTVDILGTKFTIRTLTTDENTQSFEAPAKQNYEDNIARLNIMKTEILAKAITKINNISIPVGMREKIRDLLRNTQQPALNRLFQSYQELVEKQEKLFTVEEASVEGQVQVDPEKKPGPPNLSAVEPPKPPATPPIVAADEAVDIVNPGDLVGPKR